MDVTLRIRVPDSAEGDNLVNELVESWLHDDGDISIATSNYTFATRLTYVKEV